MRTNLKIDRTFTYYSDEEVKKYCRVFVKFNHTKMMGIINDVHICEDLKSAEGQCGFKIQKIESVIDDEPIIKEDIISLAKWLAKTTISPFVTCLNNMLPKTFKVAKHHKTIKKALFIKKVDKDTSELSPRQKEVYEALHDDMRYKDARAISESVIKKLLTMGYIKRFEKDDTDLKVPSLPIKAFKELTHDQKMAYEGILGSDKLVDLLYGVTGSGKTEVYLHLARHFIEHNKQVLILVPEIALTPQMIERVKERFGDVAIYHSYLNDNERYHEYMRVLNREVNVVVGTRSAVFLPFEDLGIIIIDEEHDHSYKQDNTPCYSAKAVAFKRAVEFDAKVVLASATPSLETYSRAKKADYGYFALPKRINESMPQVTIIDLTKEIKSGGSYIISSALEKEIASVLSLKKQAIILLNRRGYAPIIRCSDCGSVLMCKDCDTALTYHKDTDELKCNMCGKTYKTTDHCPNCGSDKLVSFGLGTKRVVETLEKMFPEAKIGRMDADNTHVKNGHQRILGAFGDHQYDILVGTQMIAKGLDYPDVTLVGILNADSGLFRTSFNSPEVTFDLLMQASGRSGRAKDEGKVLIQTFNTDHYVLKAVERQDYTYFYNIEMNYRHKADYPPYTHFVCVFISDTNTRRLNTSISIFEDLTNDIDRHYRPFKLTKIMAKERYRFTFVNRDIAYILDKLQKAIDIYTSKKNVSSIKVDVDPLYME